MCLVMSLENTYYDRSLQFTKNTYYVIALHVINSMITTFEFYNVYLLYNYNVSVTWPA